MQWFYHICGNPGKFELEFQVLNWVLLTSAFMGILLTVENLILQIPSPAAESTLGVTIISLGGYYLIRIKKKFSRAIAPLLYGIYLLPATFIWFSSNGLEGAMPYFYIVPILAGATIMHGRLQLMVLSVTILHLFSLIAIERIAPQLVSPYPSEYAEWLDTLIGVIYTVSYGLGYIGILVYNLNQRMGIIRRSEIEYRQLFENSPLGIFRTTAEGKLLKANPVLLRILGYESAAELDRAGLFNLFHEPADRERFRNLAIAGPVTLFETLLQRSDGKIIPVSINGSLISGGSDGMSCFEGAMVDISVRNLLERQKEEAVESLRLSEQRYRLLAENSGDIIFTFDTALNFTYVSPAVARLRGLEASEAMAMTIAESTTPDSLEKSMVEYARILPEVEKGLNPVSRIEMELYRKDRSTVWTEVTMRPMRDDLGNLTGFVGVIHDISERKRAEIDLKLMNIKLRASEMEFRNLFEHSPVGIFRTDFSGHLLEVNPAALRMLQFENAGKINNAGLNSLFESQEDRMRLISMVQQGMVSGFETELRRGDGQIISLSINVYLEEDDEGKPLYLEGTIEDITERKHADEALRESQRRLAYIISFLPIATMVIDREGRITAWNHAMEVLTGVKSEDMAGKGDFEYALPFYGERRPILIDRVFDNEDELAENYRHIHREGGVMTAEAFIPELGKEGRILLGFASALRDARGDVAGAIESIQDITAIRNVEAELKKARDVAEEANRSKSVFLANMSHEIRTPMNAILGYAQLMQRDLSLNNELKEYLAIINRSGEHLLSLINDILEMSKIEAGRSIFIQKTFDLQGLLDDLELMFRVQTDSKGLRLLVERVGDLPRWIKSDEGKLRQVLINLVGNAVKFTEEGGVALRIGVRREAGSGMDLMFEVEDSGPGIAADEIDRVFRAFEQTKTGIRIGGTGLGLALSRGFVEIMGGELTLSSTAGKGSIFKFTIRAEDSMEEHVERREAKRKVQKLKPGQDEIRVLIADDQDTNRRLLSRMLSNVGFSIREAANGKEAIESFQEWKPRIILMDMTMPVMDGYEATRRIKATPEGSVTAIVAVTASAFEEHRQVMMDMGIDGYLAKPFKEEELYSVIRETIKVEYLYEDEKNKPIELKKAISSKRIHDAVAMLSPEFVLRLRDATKSADLDLLTMLLDEVSGSDPYVFQEIKTMAAGYAYDELLTIFS